MVDKKTYSKNYFEKIHVNYRIFLSLLVALVAYFLSRNYPPTISFMFVWIAFSASFLIFSWVVIITTHPKGLARIAGEQDNSRTLIFLIVLVSAFISLIAIIVLLQQVPHASQKGVSYYLVLATAAVFCSWNLIHTLFTLHYAHLYYTYPDKHAHVNGKTAGGLEFPGTPVPDYFDFAYFSFVLGMTFQVSDVQITSPVLRRLALLHGLVSFVYNTTIIALSINIISGIIGR